MFYPFLKKFASVFFNVLNIVLRGNLPPFGCACVIIEEQDRYLVIERPGGDLALPGGFMRWREHPTETARREGEEETGLHLEIDDLIGCYSTISNGFSRMSTLTLVYVAKVRDGELRKSVEGQPHWMAEVDLRNNLNVLHQLMLDDYLRHRGQHVTLKSDSRSPT